MKNILVTVLLFWLTLSKRRRTSLLKKTWIMLTIFNDYETWPPCDRNCQRARTLAGRWEDLGAHVVGGGEGESSVIILTVPKDFIF